MPPLPPVNASGRPGYETAKRCFDFVSAVVLLVLLSPLLVLIALAVKITSRGPALFRQERVGRAGRPFLLYKFRTMQMDNQGAGVTQAGDNRITPLGRMLRKTKLDELPQLWNVLNGTMSLVGPRPEVAKFVALYTPQQREVLSVRPGITGLCQIEYRDEERLLAQAEDVERMYIEELMPAKLEIDLRYLRQRSFWGDVGLLVRTAAALVRRG